MLISYLLALTVMCGEQQGLDDPFKGRTAAARVARDGYLHMWDVLVREAAASELLFDSYLLEKLTNLVIALNWCAHASHDFDQSSKTPPPAARSHMTLLA